MTLNELQTPPTEIEVTEVLNALRFLLSRQKSGREYLSSAVDVVRRLVFQRTAELDGHLKKAIQQLTLAESVKWDADELQQLAIWKKRLAAEAAKGAADGRD